MRLKFLTLVCACCALGPPAFAQTNFVSLRPDGAWTWYNDPRAMFHNGVLYFGYVRAGDSKTVLSSYNPQTGVINDLWTSGFSQWDDHDNPGLLRLQDGRLFANYARHGTDPTFSYRISINTNPVTPADWGAEQTISSTGAGLTYANPYQLSAEAGMLYDYSRDLNFNPTVFTSTNGGVSWSGPTLFIKTGAGAIRPYVKYSSDYTQRVDFLYTDGHPRDITNSLYHLYYQGGAFHKTDGTLVKTFANLPLLHDSGERGSVIYQYNDAAQADPNQWIPTGRAWCWETVRNTNNQPVCVFTVQRDTVTGTNWFDDRIYYYYARWTGTAWQKRFIAHAGRPLYQSEDDYAGGICVDPENPNVVYISSNAQNPFNLSDTVNVPLRANARYELWRGVTGDGGLTFSWTAVTTNSTADNLRPYIPRNHQGSPAVIWFRGSYAAFTAYNCEVVGFFSTSGPLAPAVTVTNPTGGYVLLTNLGNALKLSAAITNSQPGIFSWTTASGPTNALFSPPDSATTWATVPLAGTYVLRVTASNGALSNSAEATVQAGPLATDGPDAARVLWLKLDESSGAIAADSSGQGNNGAISGGPVWQPAGGMRGGALPFNGSNTEAVVTDAPTLDNTSAFTLSWWFNARVFTVDSGGFVCKRDGISSNNAYTTYLKRPDQHIYVDIDSANDRFASTAVISPGRWYHVALVFDGALPQNQRAKLWINGALDTTAGETSGALPNYSSNLRLGNTQAGAANWFDGSIDDVRFYRRALVSSEIRELAASNQAPSVNPGAAPAATSGIAANLNGMVTDDGRGGPLSALWAMVSGPGTAGISNPANSATTVTFSQAGPYRLRLSASDTKNEVAADLSVNVVPNTNVYADWIALYFPGETNAAIIAMAADPDGDRAANLLEFALGLNPATSDTTPFEAGKPGLPVGVLRNFNGEQYLALLVKRPIGRLGISYLAEFSGDLTTWIPGTLTGSPVNNGDGTETLTFSDAVPVAASSARFARLKVSAE